MIAALAVPVMLAACAPVVIPAGEAVRAPTLLDDKYVAADGTALPVAVWKAEKGPPRAIVLGLHGFGDYRNAFEEPAEIWAKDGITTYSYDQRGFGQSPTRGRWPGTDTLVDDARAMAALLKARYPDVPLYLAGESMGGAVALVAADRGLEVDGLVLSAPAVRSRASFGPIVSGITDLFIHVIPWLPAGPTSIDFQPTDNPRTIEKLRKDPLMIRYPRFDLAYGLLDLMDDACDSAKRVHVPYMMMHGMGDKIVPSGPVKSTIATLPRREDSKLAFYKNGYHMLMRDKEGPKVAADVAAWIADHEAALPSGADVGRSQPETAALWGSQSTR
jgi:acylglycerol lipase